MNQARRRLLSADEVRRVQLRQIGFRRGYDPAAVDELLSRLADDLAQRDREMAQLERRLDHAQREVYARRYGHLPDAAPREFNPAMIDAQVQAQRYAEELVASAQQSAAAIVEQSRLQAGNILRHARAGAERAAKEYRARAGASYTPDREELVRLATLARWTMGQVSGLRAQVDATDDAARAQLATILDRVGPLLEPPGDQVPGHEQPGSAGPVSPGSPRGSAGPVSPGSPHGPAGPVVPRAPGGATGPVATGSPGVPPPGADGDGWASGGTQPLP